MRGLTALKFEMLSRGATGLYYTQPGEYPTVEELRQEGRIRWVGKITLPNGKMIDRDEITPTGLEALRLHKLLKAFNGDLP
jgi:hypothetical protein